MDEMTTCGEAEIPVDVNCLEQTVQNPHDVLKDLLYFPAFASIPCDDELDARYYTDRGFGYCTTKISWCFLAEIIHDEYSQIPFEKNGVIALDRERCLVPIVFYPKSNRHFDFSRLKRDRTICILCANKHVFMNCQWGMLIEDLSSVTVLDCTLEEAQSLSAHYWAFKGKEKCWTCGVTLPRQELQRCGKCHTAKYCGKECQTVDWKSRHKVWCRVMPEFIKLAGFDYTEHRSSHRF